MSLTVSVQATEKDKERIWPVLEKAIGKSEFSDRVSLMYFPWRFIDHGQNPVGDCDSRPWLRVRSRTGEKAYEGYGDEYLTRFSADSIDGVTATLVQDVNNYFEKAA